MIKKITLVWIFIITACTSNIFAETGIHHSFDYTLFLGYGYFDYHEINNQLVKYHHISDMKTLPNMGLEVQYTFNHLILVNQISTSYDYFRNNASPWDQFLSFREIEDQFRIGYLIINNKNHKLFPFAGILFQYLEINTDFDYGVRTPDCFFQYKHEYSNYNFGAVYGISYEEGLPLKNNILRHIKLGVNLGGTIAIHQNNWSFDGKEIKYTTYVPGSNLRYFVQFKFIYEF